MEKTNHLLKDIFGYKRIEVENCNGWISPHKISMFFNYPKLWYEEEILGKESSFQGSTASVMGSICHYVYKCVAEGKPQIEYTRGLINEALDEYAKLKPELNLDVESIKYNWPLVATTVVNEYILKSKANLIEVEQSLTSHLGNNIYVGGTCDRLEGDVIVDYKNVSSLPNNKESIPFEYKIQLLAYAYMYRQKGYEINRIRVVYGIRPTKTLPARCLSITENIDFVADKLIQDTLTLIKDSILIVKEKPELTYLIFKSLDLKQ